MEENIVRTGWIIDGNRVGQSVFLRYHALNRVQGGLSQTETVETDDLLRWRLAK